MLEIRDLTKVYRPKKGVPVTALDGVSLRLPEQGMVFLLGKSGSGKSTLLNLLGGLDSYDSGDILIRGESTRSFRQQQFDSYRNTYVGFIFQEYNVLEEFTVGANIALAIELQGQKATDEQINAILDEVDLTGYGNRRPNELSGGQKQRVAIARALVKRPQIIMADEPTGALDSATGRQVFDTLKKLSAHRLVLVVSHDREFAEQYADRIIELADGRVVDDRLYEVETDGDEPVRYEGDAITVAPGYHLTEEDRLAINAYLDALASGGTIRGDGRRKRSVPTDNSRIPMATGGLRLVKSKLPLRCAFKIGGSSLKHKRFRLVITVLLSCIAFGLFGLSDTFGAYNHIQACTDSLVDSGVDYASVAETRLAEGSEDDEYRYYYAGFRISEEELARVRQETGVPMKGVYLPAGEELVFYDQLVSFEELEGRQLYAAQFNGFSELTAEDLTGLGYSLAAGRLPDGSKNEIAISAYVAETFVQADCYDRSGDKVAVTHAGQMVGQTLQLAGEAYTVTGLVDTGFDLTRYELLKEDINDLTTAQQLVWFALSQELSYAQDYSLHTAAFTGQGFVAKRVAEAYPVQSLNNTYLMLLSEEYETVLDPYYIGTLQDIRDARVVWLDGKERTALGDKELVVSLDLLEQTMGELPPLEDETILTAAVKEHLSQFGPLQEESERRWQENGDKVNVEEKYGNYTVVGYLEPVSLEKGLRTVLLTSSAMKADIVIPDEGVYEFAIGPMPTEESQVKQLVTFSYGEGDVRYELRNAVTYELDTIHEVLVVLADVFFWIGVGFAVFAALMLANFISVSISYKKQEIGILRAIGSRSNDVFRIFFAESFIIAMINFLLSATGVGVATAVINGVLRNQLNILLTVLHFGVRQVLLLLAVSLLVAAVASFFPVRRIAAKRPIDAIRNR